MTRRTIHILIIAASLVVGAGSGVIAQTAMEGEIGVDLENYRFRNSIQKPSRDYSVNRSLSNHFLNLRLEGPLVTERFATYTARTMFFGTYYVADSESGESDLYLKPGVPTYYGSLSLFPGRPYPLRVYGGKARNNAIRYEANNRSDLDLASPELAVVRRYQSDLESRGALWKLALSENINLTSEYKHEDVQIQRVYDFDENMNIWVDTTTFRYIPTKPLDTIDVINLIPNDTVVMFIDLNLIDSLNPGESITFALDSGRHEVDFIPLTYNSYRMQVDVRGEMLWKIVYNAPATPNDMDQQLTSVNGILQVGGTGRFQSETFYEYSSTNEQVQGLATYLNNVTNNSSYEFSRGVKVRTLTTYNSNDMTTRLRYYLDDVLIDTTSLQLTKSFMHQTSASVGSRRGMQNGFSHSYTKMSSKTNVDDFESTTHLLSTRHTVPVSRLHYTFDLKNSATLMSDNRDYVNDQYGTDLTSSFDFRLGGIQWRPENQVKVSYNEQKNPDRAARELETRFVLAGDMSEIRKLGQIKFKGEYNWRKRAQGSDSRIKNRYLLDVSLTRKFNKKYRIMMMTSQEKEMYGGTTPVPGRNLSQRDPAREDQKKSSYKVDVQAEPVQGINVNANVMLMSQQSAKITRYGASISATIPGLNIPVRSFLVGETRDLAGFVESQLSMETKLSYRFRQITITLAHSLIQQKLNNEKYKFQEIRAKISRQFTVF